MQDANVFNRGAIVALSPNRHEASLSQGGLAMLSVTRKLLILDYGDCLIGRFAKLSSFSICDSDRQVV